MDLKEGKTTRESRCVKGTFFHIAKYMHMVAMGNTFNVQIQILRPSKIRDYPHCQDDTCMVGRRAIKSFRQRYETVSNPLANHLHYGRHNPPRVSKMPKFRQVDT